MRKTLWAAAIAVALVATFPMIANAEGQYMGLVAFKSRYGKYLQAHTEGELHGSNSHVNEEETWLLYKLDADKGWVRIQNFRNQQPLTMFYKPLTLPIVGAIQPTNCPIASMSAQMVENIWIVRPGGSVAPGKVALQFKLTGKYLTTKGEGDDSRCGGEVSADATAPGGQDWEGWWTVEAAPNPPTSGRSVFTVFGDIGQGVIDLASALTDFFSHIHVN